MKVTSDSWIDEEIQDQKSQAFWRGFVVGGVIGSTFVWLLF